jgi:hypothetical protein
MDGEINVNSSRDHANHIYIKYIISNPCRTRWLSFGAKTNLVGCRVSPGLLHHVITPSTVSSSSRCGVPSPWNMQLSALAQRGPLHVKRFTPHFRVLAFCIKGLVNQPRFLVSFRNDCLLALGICLHQPPYGTGSSLSEAMRPLEALDFDCGSPRPSPKERLS